jgi:hypothetical protein
VLDTFAIGNLAAFSDSRLDPQIQANQDEI